MSIWGLTGLKLAAVAAASVTGVAAVGGALLVTRPANEPQEVVTQTNSKGFDVRTFAGRGEPGPGHGRTTDGPPDVAEFMSPTSLAADASGNIYVSDYEANVIRKIDPKGNVTTLAGTGQPGWKDGPGLEAQFNAPNGIAVGPDASVYVADALNHRIRKITSDGQVSTVAGGGPTGLGRGSFSDGPVDSARFNLPKGVAVAPDGTLYVADTDNLRIRRISEGVVSTFAGTGEHGSKDGDRSDATFSNVAGISISSDGSLFVADQPASLIRRIGPSGQVTTVARGLLFPAAAVAMAGGLLVADTGNQRVLQLDPQGAVVSQAGSGRQGFADANGSAAEFFNPTAVLLVGNHIYVADSDNHRIRTMEVLP